MATCMASSSSRFAASASTRLSSTATSRYRRSVPGVSEGSFGLLQIQRFSTEGKHAPSKYKAVIGSTSSRSSSTSSSSKSPVSALAEKTSRRLPRSSLSARATSTAAFNKNQGDETSINPMVALILSSAMMAGTYAVITTHSSATTTDAVSTGTTYATKFGRSGGGGNEPNRAYASFLEARRNAEEDVRRYQLDAVKKPYTVSTGAVQGARWAMEDEYKIANGGRFAAVFDGHGGHAVSRFLRDRLYDTYTRLLSLKHWEERDDLDLGESKIPSISSQVGALRDALEEVDRDVLKDDRFAYQGSTAVAVVLHVSEDGHRTLLSANVGDSRAILSRGQRAIDLTRDHKPNDERERARIMSQGEELQWDPHAQLHRVRNLSLSRAIGDKFAKPAVSGEPEIRHFPVGDEDEFILLASDGLWDVMTSQEVVDFVHASLDNLPDLESLSEEDRAYYNIVQCKNMARKVANEALHRGSQDNVCVLVVWLDDKTAAFEK